jgi:hypothetical protein
MGRDMFDVIRSPSRFTLLATRSQTLTLSPNITVAFIRKSLIARSLGKRKKISDGLRMRRNTGTGGPDLRKRVKMIICTSHGGRARLR